VRADDLSERKWRLFAVACCREILPMCPKLWHREAFEMSERIADSAAPGASCESVRELYNASVWRQRVSEWSALPRWSRVGRREEESTEELIAAERALIDLGRWWRVGRMASERIVRSVLLALAPSESARSLRKREEHDVRFAAVLREIAGNPFGLDTFDSNWRTWTATELARMMYDSREFSLMPILADALQDAGCDDEELLSHCRNTKQAHVRGCWVVDLVLGRS
jgi:hypothetical protein